MIDVWASERHYIDHLAPVWAALPERGVFAVPTPLGAYARGLGLNVSTLRVEPAPTLVASFKDQKYVRRRGRTQIARMEHGAGQAYIGMNSGSYPGGADCGEVSLFLCPNAYSASRWAAAYPRSETVIVGSPKLDTLPVWQTSSFRSSPTVAVSFHFDYGILPETRSAFPFYRDALVKLAAEFNVIGHAHPRAWPMLSRWYQRVGIEPVQDFADVLARADVYACDNSSTLFEAATMMPVVVINRPDYRRDVHHGLRFWTAADVGVQVDHPDHLSAAVTVALADAPERRAAREAALDVVYAHRDGKAAKRAASAVLAWAGARMAVAA